MPGRAGTSVRMRPEHDTGTGGTAAGPRPGGALEKVHALLVSPRLAIALLVAVLACCVVGVTVLRGARAGELIFSTLWFNALLVLLALSSAAAFFSRIWRRRLTLVSAGMILFHLSFAALLGGIAYNRLFFFDGLLRLTEGETLPTGRVESYDRIDKGRFFDLSRLGGETTLVRMHANYKVSGANKQAAYEIAVEDGEARARSVIYVTEYLDFDGVRFFCSKEGFSVLVVMSDRGGREIYGAHVPLQSFKQEDGSYLYAAGTAAGPTGFSFPPPPEHPRADLELSFRPNTVVERAGDVRFRVWPLGRSGVPVTERAGEVPVGGHFEAGDLTLSPREIRYWVGMNVRHDPGLPVILASLCFGLAGMVMTFAGRVRQGLARSRSAYNRAPAASGGVRTESAS